LRIAAGLNVSSHSRSCSRQSLRYNAVMAVLFLVFGAKLIADGLPPLT
jgi:hypothetical protein